MLAYGFDLGEQGVITPDEQGGCDGGIRSQAPTIEKTMIPVMLGLASGFNLGIILSQLTDMGAARAAQRPT